MRPDAFSNKLDHLEHDYRERCEGLLSDNWRKWVDDKQLRRAISSVVANGQTAPSFIDWSGVPHALGVDRRNWHPRCALGYWLRERAKWLAEAIKKTEEGDE